MKEIIAKGKIDGKDIEVRCLSDKNKYHTKMGSYTDGNYEKM